MNERDPFASLKAVPYAKGEVQAQAQQLRLPHGLYDLFSGAWSATQEELEQALVPVEPVGADQPESQVELPMREASAILVSYCRS